MKHTLTLKRIYTRGRYKGIVITEKRGFKSVAQAGEWLMQVNSNAALPYKLEPVAFN